MKKIILFLIMFVFMGSVIQTKALCSSDELKILKEKAKKIEFIQEYEIVEYEDYLIDVAKEARYKITAYNLDKDVNVVVSYANEEEPELKKFKYNDKKTSSLTDFYGGKLKVRIEGNTKNCSGNVLRVQYIDLLFYNQLFNSDDCKIYPEFEYCQSEFTKDYVDNVVFENKLEKYIEKLEKEKEKENEKKDDEENDNNLFKRIAIIIVSVVVVIAVVSFAGYFVVKYIKKEKEKRKL